MALQINVWRLDPVYVCMDFLGRCMFTYMYTRILLAPEGRNYARRKGKGGNTSIIACKHKILRLSWNLCYILCSNCFYSSMIYKELYIENILLKLTKIIIPVYSRMYSMNRVFYWLNVKYYILVWGFFFMLFLMILPVYGIGSQNFVYGMRHSKLPE